MNPQPQPQRQPRKVASSAAADNAEVDNVAAVNAAAVNAAARAVVRVDVASRIPVLISARAAMSWLKKSFTSTVPPKSSRVVVVSISAR